MDVSFIIPALNEEKYIEACLRSIKAQKTKLKFEIIVADGSSTDNTVKIAKKYAKVFTCKKKGIAFARNYGAKFSKGKLLVFIDADTVIQPDYTTKIWDYLKARPKVVAVTAAIDFDAKGLIFSTMFCISKLYLRLFSFFGRSRLVGIDMAVWRNIFEKVCGFPEVPSEDIAMASLLKRYGETKYFVGTRVISSGRRFKNPFKMLVYYISRDIVTMMDLSRSKKLKSIAKKLEKRDFVKYKPLR